MTTIESILEAFDQAWDHQWESLVRTCAGVTEAEASWQAPCYAAEAAEAGWPAPGTIAWQVAHIAHCKRHYTAFVRDRACAAPPAVEPRRPLASFAEEWTALEAAHAAQRAGIAVLSDEELPRVACGKTPLGAFLAMSIRHDTWHAAQIAVARRLYRTRGAAS